MPGKAVHRPRPVSSARRPRVSAAAERRRGERPGGRDAPATDESAADTTPADATAARRRNTATPGDGATTARPADDVASVKKLRESTAYRANFPRSRSSPRYDAESRKALGADRRSQITEARRCPKDRGSSDTRKASCSSSAREKVLYTLNR